MCLPLMLVRHILSGVTHMDWVEIELGLKGLKWRSVKDNLVFNMQTLELCAILGTFKDTDQITSYYTGQDCFTLNQSVKFGTVISVLGAHLNERVSESIKRKIKRQQCYLFQVSVSQDNSEPKIVTCMVKLLKLAIFVK